MFRKRKEFVKKEKKSKKLLWALAMLIAFPVLFNVLSVFIGKRYTAEMRIEVDQSNLAAQEVGNPYAAIDDISNGARPRSPQTQLDVLTGTIVLQDALQMAADRMPDKIRADGNAAALYENLVKRLQVDNELNSDILSVRVTEDDPEIAAELANDIGLAYIDYSKKVSKEAGSMMGDQLEQRIGPLKTKLASIDAKIAALKSKSSVYDLPTTEANLGATKEAADRGVAAAEAAFEGSKAQLAVAQNEIKSVPEYINSGSHTQMNPLVVSLQTSLAGERVQLAQLRAQYQDNFPSVREEKQKIADLEKQLKGAKVNIEGSADRSVNPVYQNMQSTVAQLRSAVQSNAGQLAAAKVEQQRATAALTNIPQTEQQLQGLVRDRTVTEQTYEALEQRLSMVQSNGMARQPTSRIVSSALPPSVPSFPDHRMLTLVGLALGVFFAVLVLMPRPELQTPLAELETLDIVPAPAAEDGGVLTQSSAAAFAPPSKKTRRQKSLSSEEQEALATGPNAFGTSGTA